MPATLFGWSMTYRIVVLGLIFTLFTGCYKNHLYVQQEWVDRNFLASTKVGTPDPRQACPPEGQRILVAWKFPANLYYQDLQLLLTVRFWDNSEEVITYPIERRWSNTAFNFFQQKILTYRIQVVNRDNEIVETWEHHFWTELIDIDRNKDSVSSQPRQGSVIEIPKLRREGSSPKGCLPGKR